MDKRLFYCYMKYQKERNDTIWKRLKKIPWLVKTVFVVMLVCSITFFIPLFQKYMLWIAVIEVILSLILWFLVENFQIKTSDEKLEEYYNYCRELEIWLNSQGLVSVKAIKLLRKRLNNRIDEMRKQRKDNNARFDKWIQTLVIPITLAVFSTIIKGQDSIEMFSTIFLMLSVFAFIYGFVSGCRSYAWFPKKRVLEQMGFFASDLQGILDLRFAQEDKSNGLTLVEVKICKNETYKIDSIKYQKQKHKKKIKAEKR